MRKVYHIVMLDPYRMVFVNLITFFILLAGVFIYKFIYPKKKINLFYLLILISILPVISMLRAGTYQSGDFNIHIYRSMEFYNSLKEGIIMPSWAKDLNATYGLPLFAFNYTLPYYLISFFHFLGFSFIASMKLFLGVNLILSGIFMYVMAKDYFKNRLAAFSTAIFYIFAPYHLISTHFKITIGEILTFAILPLLFLFVNRFISRKKPIDLILSGFFLGILAMSHIYIAIITVPILFVYVLFYLGINIRSLIFYFIILFTGALVSAYQWSAPLIYNSYLFIHIHPIDVSKMYYPTLIDLLYAPWRFGFLFQGPKGQLSFLIGYAQLFVIAAILFYIVKNKLSKKIKPSVIAWLLLLLLLIIFMNPVSKPVWESLPFIGDPGTQRLLILISFVTSILAGYFVIINIKKTRIIWLLILFAIGSTILNWGQRTVIPQINDKILTTYIPLSTYTVDMHFYSNSRWVNPNHQWFSIVPKQYLDILKGQAIINNTKRLSTVHAYTIDALTPVTLRENTLYFPGWEALANGKQIKMGPDKNGVITFDLPKGQQTLILTYHDLYLFALAKNITLLSILIIILYSIYYYKKNIANLFSKALDIS